MRLAHLHLPRIIPYSYSLRLQEALLEKQFAYNTSVLQSSKNAATHESIPPLPPPPPTLLTFQTDPVYTVGRRHLKSNPLSQTQIDFLTTSNTTTDSSQRTQLATFYPSPRGGLLTYHAPGQLTAYLIVNLRAHSITPRCFIRLLENSVIRTCARHGVSNTLTTEDPGVWIGKGEFEVRRDLQSSEESCQANTNLQATTRKICAIGVHVTRGVTSHGIGLNVCDTAITKSPLTALYTQDHDRERISPPAPGYLSWGFGRIVACGLEGKSVTWLTDEGADAKTNPDMVAESLAEEVCNSLTRQGKVDVTGVVRVKEEDILADSPALVPDEAE